MPLKYYCPKCDKRFIDWGAEKLGFKCPDCKDETLYRVGTQPEGENGAPVLSKSAAKRKTKAKSKVSAGVSAGESDDDMSDLVSSSDDDSMDEDVDLDDDDDGESIGDSLSLDDD